MLKEIEYLILIAYIYSFFGWLIESVGGIFTEKKFVNRGFLIGPICPVYGIGVAGITLLLSRYANDIPVLLILIAVLSGSLEYFTGFIMEKIFHARWWDYHNFKFNINGRICLETLIPFAVVGSFIICVVNPQMFKLFDKIPLFVLQIIVLILSILFIIDFIISFKIMLSFKGSIYEDKDNTEEISNKVKQKTEEMTDAVKIKTEEMTDAVKTKTGNVIKKAQIGATMFGRQIKLNKIKIKRKARYTRKQITSTAIKPIKALYKELNYKRDSILKLLENGKIEIDKQIKSKQRIISEQIIENFKKKSILSKRLIDAFPKVKISIKEIKLKKDKE